MKCRKEVQMTFLAVGVAVALTMLAGCTNVEQQVKNRLDTLEGATLPNLMRDSLARTGGLETWFSTDSVSATVLAISADADGGRTLIEQHHVLFPGPAASISVTSVEPEGNLEESLTRKGLVKLTRDGAPSRRDARGTARRPSCKGS